MGKGEPIDFYSSGSQARSRALAPFFNYMFFPFTLSYVLGDIANLELVLKLDDRVLIVQYEHRASLGLRIVQRSVIDGGSAWCSDTWSLMLTRGGHSILVRIAIVQVRGLVTISYCYCGPRLYSSSRLYECLQVRREAMGGIVASCDLRS